MLPDLLVIALLCVVGGLLWYTRPRNAPSEAQDAPGGSALYLDLNRRVSGLERALDALDTTGAEDVEEIRDAVLALARDLDTFERTLEEKVDETKRRERRIRATLQRAAQKYEDGEGLTPGLEAELAELRERDAGGSPEEGVPTVHGPVETDRESSIPGVSLEQLWRERGMIQ